MAPSKFQIYVDPNAAATSAGQQQPPQQQQQQHYQAPPIRQVPDATNIAPERKLRYIPEVLKPDQQFCFDIRKIYPQCGGEFSFEELNLQRWQRRQKELIERQRLEDLERENSELKHRIEALEQLLANQAKQMPQSQLPRPQSPPTNRLSIVPRSLQPTQDLEYNNAPLYGAIDEAPSIAQNVWGGTCAFDMSRNTFAHDKFTLPIDQSQYIKENVPTSTPTRDEKRSHMRRMSRPSMGGSPTLKLSPITETSRDCNSKSSSSATMSGTPGTPKEIQQPIMEPVVIEEPERPLDPNDPSTYRGLLKGLPEPLERRSGYHKMNRSLPKIRQGACFQAGSDTYLVDKELSREARMFTAQLLTDDSNDCSSDMPIKTICFRLDQPANEWLFYICNELHRRLVKQRTKPDIELSVMIANPAVMYNDGSILVDEYLGRFVSLDHFLEACVEMNKPFPKSVAAYILLELIQLAKQMHACDIVHMRIFPENVLITCCPTRDDIANVDERTSIVKLIGFDRAMDLRRLPAGYQFETKIDDLVTCEMLDGKPWTYQIDWFGVLKCVHKMFFLSDMNVSKSDEGRWTVDKQFKDLPTDIWGRMFDGLLNINDLESATVLIDEATKELNTWVKANISFVLKEADSLDRIYEDYCKASNKSIRM